MKKLLNSNSPEVSIVANMVARCARSNTGKNLINIERETKLDPWVTESWRVREAIKRTTVPVLEGRRLHYLGNLLNARLEMETNCKDLEEINGLIDSLCSS